MKALREDLEAIVEDDKNMSEAQYDKLIESYEAVSDKLGSYIRKPREYL